MLLSINFLWWHGLSYYRILLLLRKNGGNCTSIIHSFHIQDHFHINTCQSYICNNIYASTPVPITKHILIFLIIFGGDGGTHANYPILLLIKWEIMTNKDKRETFPELPKKWKPNQSQLCWGLDHLYNHSSSTNRKGWYKHIVFCTY